MPPLPNPNTILAVPHRGEDPTNASLLWAESEGQQPLPAEQSIPHPAPIADGYRFFHFHQVSDAVPGPEQWCVCLDRNEKGAYEAVGVGRADATAPGWFEGPGIAWMYEALLITATSDPHLIARGIPAFSEAKLAELRQAYHLYPISYSHAAAEPS